MSVNQKQHSTNRLPVSTLPSRRSAVEMVDSTLEEVPTHFGRLVYLVRCRGKDGRYSHHGLELTRDSKEVDKALLSAHERIFRDWLNLQLVEQHEDLSTYLDGFNVKQVLKTWRASSRGTPSGAVNR